MDLGTRTALPILMNTTKTRIVDVECATPRLLRWLRCNVRGARTFDYKSFVVFDEAAWAESLAAAEGKEVQS